MSRFYIHAYCLELTVRKFEPSVTKSDVPNITQTVVDRS